MSKSITIPTNCNPYIVVINNHVYVYKAGETIEVPDEVAEAIEDAIELVPKQNTRVSRVASLINRSITELNANDFAGVENIGNYAFSYCTMLTSVSFSSTVTSIGLAAFSYCSGLKRFIVPNTISSIAGYAFSGCTGLQRVIMRPTTPPKIQAETFINVPDTCVFEVPSEALEAYKTAPNWSALASRIVAIEE